MDQLRPYPEIKAYLALIIVYIVWGTTLGAIHIGITSIPPALFVSSRFLLAGSILFLFCIIKGEKLPDIESIKKHCIIGFLLFFAGHSLSYWILQYVSTGFGAIFTATNPFWMIWLASAMPPKEKIPSMAIGGILLGFIGMMILLSPKLFKPYEISMSFWLSTLGMLIMAFFWCAGAIYARKESVNTSIPMGLSIQNLFAGLLLTPICLFTVDLTRISPRYEALLALGYLVLMGTIVATSCYLYTLKKLAVPTVSTTAYVTPVVTIIVGWLFLGEQISLSFIFGALVILTGVLLVQRGNQCTAEEITE